MKDRNANEVLEGACKVMGGTPTLLVTAGSAIRRKTPRSRSRGQGRRWSRKAKRVATSGRQTPKISTIPRRAWTRGTRDATAGDRTVATPQRTRESNLGNEHPADRDSKYSGRNTGDSRDLGWSVSLHPRPPPSFRVQLNPGIELAAFPRYSHRKATIAPRDPSFGR